MVTTPPASMFSRSDRYSFSRQIRVHPGDRDPGDSADDRRAVQGIGGEEPDVVLFGKFVDRMCPATRWPFPRTADSSRPPQNEKAGVDDFLLIPGDVAPAETGGAAWRCSRRRTMWQGG